jgi:hypothetical protein
MHSRISELEFKIQQLRLDKVILAIESIAMVIGALFTIAILPQLLLQYVYDAATLTAEPPLLTYIPVVGFAIAAIYFVYATVMIVMKKLRINAYEKELNELRLMVDEDGCECGHDHGHHHHEMEDMSEYMEEEVVKPARKSKTKKSTKK